MDLALTSLRIPFEKDGMPAYEEAAAEKLGIGAQEIRVIKLLSKALDASDAETFYYVVSLAVRVSDSFDNRQQFPAFTETKETPKKIHAPAQKPIIVGFGPAGMFAALAFIDQGIQPLIFEQGKKIEERTKDVEKFIDERKLNTGSNIQFGEGGAGAYSDGKLFSRIKNSPYADRVLDTFIRFGAPAEIGYIRKPHLGTDMLRRIVRKIRDHILARGGEIHFGSKVTDILVDGDTASGIVINGEKKYHSSAIYLAVGHSSRDTFEMLHKKGLVLEQKPISVGVRIEHPAETINRIRYDEKYKRFPGIGAASYSFTHTDKKAGRGVYSFCMCPGGEILNASSEQGLLVVNGMSYSHRSSPFSNAAIAVTCHTADFGSEDPLAGIAFQKNIEQRAFQAAGGTWKAPAQNLVDFLCGRRSEELNAHSYRMGAVSADLREIFPEFICQALMTAFTAWQQDYPLFISDQGILMGAETRTSSPLRIKRSSRYESVAVKNIYPIGEGSGYSGGITSSAIDAIKAVEASNS